MPDFVEATSNGKSNKIMCPYFGSVEAQHRGGLHLHLTVNVVKSYFLFKYYFLLFA